MIRWLLRRLLALVATLLVIGVASFMLLRIAPGGPFDQEKDVPEAVLRELERYYGLDLPLAWNADAKGLPAHLTETQLGRWLGGVLRGDLGPSFQYKGRSVNEVLAAGAAASAAVGILAIDLAVLLGIGLGALAAARVGSRADRWVRAAGTFGIAVPNYVVAVGLAYVFGLSLRWLPLGGFGTPAHLVMPAFALALPHAAVISRLVRSSLLSVLGEDFVRTARAKGISEFRVVWAHALRPSLAPVIQYLGPATASVVTGSLAIEAIFQVPGMGAHFVNAALNRDYTLVMGTVLVYAAILLMLNTAADVAAAWLDPRLRLTEEAE